MNPPQKTQPALASQLSDIRGRVTRTQWIWLMNTGICILTLAIGFMAVQTPWQDRRRQLQSQYAEEKEQTELLWGISTQRKELQKLEKSLLLEGGTTALTSQISRLASEAGLQIESVTPQPEFPIDPYLKYQIEILANSNLVNALRFLHSIETHQPLFWVDQLEIGELLVEPSTTFAGISFGQESNTAEQVSDQHRIRLIVGALSRQRTS